MGSLNSECSFFESNCHPNRRAQFGLLFNLFLEEDWPLSMPWACCEIDKTNTEFEQSTLIHRYALYFPYVHTRFVWKGTELVPQTTGFLFKVIIHESNALFHPSLSRFYYLGWHSAPSWWSPCLQNGSHWWPPKAWENEESHKKKDQLNKE